MRDDPVGAYDPLLDAEREALSRSGRRVDKVALIRALREASGLGLAEARRAVEGYLARRGGRAPEARVAGRPAGWIDDLLDSERSAAVRDGRRLTRILLIKALRDASGLGLRQSRHAVEDYLLRRGGEGLASGRGGGQVALVVVLIVIAGLVALVLIRG